MKDKYKYKSITELTPYKTNARTHSAEQIEKIGESIKEFGFINPVLIDGDGEIIAGHGRVAAAELIGMDKVPTLLVDHLTEAQKRAYIIADNRLAEDASWDEDILKIELTELAEMDFNIELTGFGFDFIDDEEAEVAEDDFDEEPPEEPKAKLGEIYRLGEHRLMCGDSTKTEDVERLMGGCKADLFLTDPPYNIGYEGKTKDALTIENDSMSREDFLQFLSDAFALASDHLVDGGVFYIWHPESESMSFLQACERVGWQIRQVLIWNKNNFTLGRQDYQWKHEPCIYGWKDGAAHYWGSDRSQTTVLDFDRPSRSAEHPTMKPVELIAYQVKNSSESGDTVLDLFGGSGSTLIACEQLGRRCYMMELDPKYVDVIISRWETFTGGKAELIED